MEFTIPDIIETTDISPSLRILSKSIKAQIDYNDKLILDGILKNYNTNHIHTACIKAIMKYDTETIRKLATVYSKYLPIVWDELANLLLDIYELTKRDNKINDIKAIQKLASYIKYRTNNDYSLALDEEIINDNKPLQLNIPATANFGPILANLLKYGRKRMFTLIVETYDISDVYIENYIDLGKLSKSSLLRLIDVNNTHDLIDPGTLYLIDIINSDKEDDLDEYLSIYDDDDDDIAFMYMVSSLVCSLDAINCFDITKYSAIAEYNIALQNAQPNILSKILEMKNILDSHLSTISKPNNNIEYKRSSILDKIIINTYNLYGDKYHILLLSMALKFGFSNILDKYVRNDDIIYLRGINDKLLDRVIEYKVSRRNHNQI